MFISVFDIFKIGLGPSSSHTMGPMLAARRFVCEVARRPDTETGPLFVQATLYGSLAYTGEAHGTHRAVLLGLLGVTPETYDREEADRLLASLEAGRDILLLDGTSARIAADRAIVVRRGESLPGHANGMKLALVDAGGTVLVEETYYSTGGGFAHTESELQAGEGRHEAEVNVPYGFGSAAEMLEMVRQAGLSIADMKRANEQAHAPGSDIDARIDGIWLAMAACMNRGLSTGGELPGGLHVKRRAAALHADLQQARRANLQPPHAVNDWLNAWAMAVNEENAAGGQVVTAPTNGAAGVIPAVIRYARDQIAGIGDDDTRRFLLTAAAMGGLIKFNALISGAEVGCQGEIGSASAMAAAGLCALLGGTNAQIENAAEIALEHHLGMTAIRSGAWCRCPASSATARAR